MRRSFLAAALILGCVGASADPADRTYTDDTLHFTILIPANWKEFKPSGDVAQQGILSPDYDETGERCNFAAATLPDLAGVTQEKLDALVRSGQLRQVMTNNGVALTASEVVDRGTYLVQLGEGKATIGGKPSMTYRAMTLAQGRFYEVACVVHESDYPRARPELDRIVRSFTVTP